MSINPENFPCYEEGDEKYTWVNGSARCLDCGKNWVAVYTLGSEFLECPNCGSRNTDRDLSPDIDVLATNDA